MKRLIRGISRDERVREAVSWLLAWYIRFVHRTTRWDIVGGDILERHWNAGIPFIAAFWHSRLLMMVCQWRSQQPVHMLISQHADGRFIARTVDRFGLGVIAGSSRRGGADAVRAMVKALKAGESIGITPDGPRGPRQRIGAGPISLARLSGAPILPVTYSFKHRILLKSWDRLLVPLPFGKAVLVCGRPVEVPREASEAALEALREEVEERLNAITAAADTRMGHKPVEPAPWPAQTAAHARP